MLREEILSTLAYYDVLDMPLTAEEVFRFLIKSPDYDIPTFLRMSECCEELVREGKLGRRGKYFFLFDREYLVPLRQQRRRLAQAKWHRAISTMKYLRMVPFVRLIFASGSLSMDNTDELSDLDIIIVAKHGRIWLTRLLVAGLLSLLGRRRKHDDRIAPDKICPNHFITDASLAIPFRSMYTAQLYANLVPLVVTDHQLLKDFQIANEWLFHYLHHWIISPFPPYHKGGLRGVGEFFLSGFLGDRLENLARRYQKKRIATHAAPLHPGGHLTYTDEALAFHAQSSETHILSAYENSQGKLTI